MIELEKTYLAKRIPEGLQNCRKREIIDIYIPQEAYHPVIRIRNNGGRLTITKKEPIEKNDASHQKEQKILLTKAEYEELVKLGGKKVRKIRYYYGFQDKVAEFDVFQDALKGLVLIDFEFASREEKYKFAMPDFCLAEVTQKEFVAGGMLCGKSFKDLEKDLKKFGYQKLFLGKN